VLTRTHGTWDYLILTSNTLVQAKQIKGKRLRLLIPAYMDGGCDPSFRKDLLRTITKPINHNKYYDCIAFGTVYGPHEKTPYYWNDISVSSSTSTSLRIPQGFREYCPRKIMHAIQHTCWHDALVFRRAMATGSIVPLMSKAMSAVQRTVIVAPESFRFLESKWPNTKFFSTQWPEYNIFKKDGKHIREELELALLEDSKLNPYTIYLFQAGAVAQSFIYTMFQANPNHAYIDLGQVLSVWGNRVGPGGWFIKLKRQIAASMGDFIKETAGINQYNFLMKYKGKVTK